MSKVDILLGLGIGAVTGSVATYFLMKNKFEEETQNEIDKFKKSYLKKCSVGKPEETPVKEEPKVEVSDIKKQADDIMAKQGYTNYSQMSEKKKEDKNVPFVIPPEEFGEDDDIPTHISLTYFSDGVLIDDNDEVIMDADDRLGDFASHFGEYEDDSVYIRNVDRFCDYEILRVNQTYKEFLIQHPYLAEG